MKAIDLTVNGNVHTLEASPEMPLLWALRDRLGLTGTKYSCGIGQCGSCTVLVDGEAVQSCTQSLSAVAGKSIITIEGLAANGRHPLQQAWIDGNVPQCGYCQPGQIMTAVALLANNPNPDASKIDEALSGNLCRCGTYQRIRQAIQQAALNGEAVGQLDIETAQIGSLGENESRVGLLPLVGAMVIAGAGSKAKLSRRNFLQVSAAAGAGLVIGLYLPGCKSDATVTPEAMVETAPTVPPASPTETSIPASGATATSPPSSPTTAGSPTPPSATPEPEAWFEPNLYLQIDNNGLVTIVVHRTEMGQGARTAMPMIVAEELEVDLASVRVEQATGDGVYGKQATSGSSCIPETFMPLRMAGAQARVMLIAAAAQTWGVDVDSCYAESGAVVHEPTDRRLAYGELVETAASLPPTRGQLKDAEDFKLIGSRIGQLENPQIVEGSAVFGADIQLTDMLYATVARSPVLRDQVTDFDATQAEAIEGVRHIVPIDSGVAVVADSTWAAFQGRQALALSWAGGRYADFSGSSLRQDMLEEAESWNSGAENKLESIYEISFLTHVAPSPMNATADVRRDSCEVWAPTQSPQLARSRAASITKLPTDAVTVHVPRVGGGFGRRIKVDYVEEAVQISQAIGAPVKLTWTREDDVQHGFFHPLSVHHASVDLEQPKMPRIRSQEVQEWDRLIFAWRAVSNFTDAFVRECFLDEMADALGRDPLEMRLELGPQALKEMQEVAAREAGWGGPLPEGRSRGIAAFSTWDVTPVAMVAEVSVAEGTVQVHRVVCAIDCGTVINPDLVEAQMEGGIAWGLSALLHNPITIEEGQVQQSNVHDYPILRLQEMPAVEVHIVPSSYPPRGVGEMGVPPIAPAVLNGVFAATGKRIRHLPIRLDDLRDV